MIGISRYLRNNLLYFDTCGIYTKMISLLGAPGSSGNYVVRFGTRLVNLTDLFDKLAVGQFFIIRRALTATFDL